MPIEVELKHDDGRKKRTPPKFLKQVTLQKIVDPKYVLLSGAVDDETIKKNICTKKECLSNDNPHRHQIVSFAQQFRLRILGLLNV